MVAHDEQRDQPCVTPRWLPACCWRPGRRVNNGMPIAILPLLVPDFSEPAIGVVVLPFGI